jgi:hypothetical protein
MLKPSELKLDGVQYTIPEYENLVRKKINSLSNKKLLVVLNILIDSKSGDKVNIDGITSNILSEIKNYYAEVIGPILVYKNNLFPQGKLNSRSTCYFSSSQTERLYDFKIISNKKEYLFSNKQLKGGTNTLKPADIVDLVEKDDILKSKWENTKVFKTFKILNESNVVSGPIKAVAQHYVNNVSGISKQDMNAVIQQLTQNDVIIKNPPKSIMALVKRDSAALENFKKNGFLNGTTINFLFEKVLMDISKSDSDYNELFLDATTKNVQFFKFDLNNKGVITYEVSNPRKSAKKATLRSKQGVERRSSSGKLKLDKLGFQP